MTSPEIKILISIAAIVCIYGFVCQIQLTRQAGNLSKRVARDRPDLWSQLNPIARNWNGGQPGLKFLYRTQNIDIPGFKEDYNKLQILERRLLWAIAIGAACIALAGIGTKLNLWQW